MPDPTPLTSSSPESPLGTPPGMPTIVAERDRSERWCRRCGGRNPWSWSMDSDRWNVATRHDDWLNNAIMCPGCFVELHEEATGLRTTWRLVPDPMTPFRHIEDLT